MSTVSETAPSSPTQQAATMPPAAASLPAPGDSSSSSEGSTWDWWALLFGLACLLLLGTMHLFDLVGTFLAR